MRKRIFISLFLFLCFFSSTATAIPSWKDTCENYPTGTYTDYWTYNYYTTSGGSGSVTTAVYDAGYPTLDSLKVYVSQNKDGKTSQTSIISNEYIFEEYFSFTVHEVVQTVNWHGTCTGTIELLDASSNIAATKTFQAAGVYEVIKVGSDIYLYFNGESQGIIDTAYYDSGEFCKVKLGSKIVMFAGSSTWATPTTCTVYYDDMSTESCIGISPEYNEFITSLECSYRIQGLAQHPNYNYAIWLTSLSADNAGLINETELSNLTYSEYITWDLSPTLGENYGLYVLSLMRDNLELDRDYFIYSLSTDPIPFPEILFLAGTNVNADIRDDDNNGGETSSAGSVYLYPAVNENGVYNISYDIQETPASFSADITKIYNTSPINSTNFTFSGIAGNNYFVTLNGAGIGNNAGSDIFQYNLSSWDSNTYSFSFDPDYTVPGVWGYIKNSETQNPIKSATVKVSNNSETYYLFTDSNGQYYKTIDMVPGVYTIIASKSGYTTSNPYNITAVNGTTTRQDIFLDPASGSGVYYASHDVTFTVLEYWYSSVGLPGVAYAVYDDENESVKNGTTGSKGTFTVTEMDAGKNYTFILTYNNQTYTEYLEPGLTEYTLVLNKEGIVHQYYNSWLNLTYSSSPGNISVSYISSINVSSASLAVKNNQGSTIQTNSSSSLEDQFNFTFTEGDYIVTFNIISESGLTASQSWAVSYPQQVKFLPDSYPNWLKNLLFVAVILFFLLSFGKSKNDIACGAAAVLSSIGYYFSWLSCSFNLIILVWIIAAIAVYIHYKRTGAVG